MLETLLTIRSTSVPDEAANDEAVANALASGVRVRDYGTRPSSLEPHEPIPEIFRARDKALIFHHMRWLYSHGVFDTPHVSLTVEDVDRLHTAVKCQYLSVRYSRTSITKSPYG